MSVTLYSPNRGADGVAKDILATLNSFGLTRFADLKIDVFRGDGMKRKEKADTLRLTMTANLFIVEQLNMPNPNGEGALVLVYKTTLRIGAKTYNAVCYTHTTGKLGSGIIDLTPKGLMKIGEYVGKTTTPGIWQSLLNVERLKYFRFS